MTYANGASQSDKNGNLLTETDALGNKVQYAYTPEGWLESITRADGTVLTFEYDKTGSLLVQNVGDGQTVESSYNEIGMVTEVSSAEGTIVYQYNGQGYLVSVTNVNGDVVSYTYDAYGNKTSMTYPDGRTVSYTYDRMNRMTSVTGLDGDVTRYAYDAAGRRVETASSTLTTAYSYDSVGNLLTQATSGASEIAFSYSYNKNGYITGEVRTEGGKTTESTYAYDALGQLTSFLQSTGYEEQYAYDKAGNMTEKVLTGTDGIETALKMSYNKGNQLTTMVNGKDKIAYTYDKNGSMVTKVLTSQAYGKLTDAYAYNALDQLTEYVGYDGYKQEFTYDANGMRLSKSEVGNGNRSTLEELLRGNIAGLPEIVEPTQSQTNADEAGVPAELDWATTEYLYDLTQEYYQVISETTTSSGGASSTTAYAYGLERIAAFTSDSRTSYVYDGRGSVAQAITAPVTGEAVSSALPDVSVQVQSFSYTAFGEQMGNVKVSGFSYNAEAYDAATGMLNLRARQYEPALGRFSQKDIVRGQVRSPLSLNRYIYCINNPINLIDPNGKAPNFSAIAMGGITAGAIAGVTAKKLKTSAAQVKTALRNLKNAITGGYNAAANSTDINVQKAYNQALKEISAAEKSNKKPLTDKEKNRIFAEACIVHSLQLSYEYGVSSSNAFTYDETIAIGKSVQSQYKAYSARQKKDTKANYCIKFVLAPYEGTTLYSDLLELNNEWKALGLTPPYSPLTTSSAVHAGLVGISSRALLKAGIERNEPMQQNVALAVSVGKDDVIKIKLPGTPEYIELYDSQQYSLSLDEQRRLVGLSGITGSLDIVLTNSNADSNTLYGKDYAQNHGILLLSPTTYAGVNSNAWPKNNENTNFITQYSQSNNSKIIGFDYVIINNNSAAIEELSQTYTYFDQDFEQWR